MLPLLLCSVLLGGCVEESGIATTVKVIDYVAGKQRLAQISGIGSEEHALLDSGDLLSIKEKYEARPEASLSLNQHRLLCDIHIRHNDFKRADACLQLFEARLKQQPERKDEYQQLIIGRRALLYSQIGDYPKAFALSKGLTLNGGRYLHALAAARLGKNKIARRIADRFALQFDPKRTYFAVNIYAALGDYKRALELALDPERRLSKDYGLKPFKDVFGNTIQPAIFRIDLFDEFQFGLLGAFSYAPKGNPYVEFIIAKSYIETGDLDEAAIRFDTLLHMESSEVYRDLLWMSLYERGRIEERRGNLRGATEFHLRSIDTLEDIRSSIATETGRLGFSADKYDVYGRLIRILNKQNRLPEAVEIVERAKSRALVDMLSTRRNMDENASSTSGELLRAYTQAENRLAQAQATETPAAITSALQRLDQARQTLLSQAPGLASLVTVQPVSYQQIIDSLAPGETALLSYVHGADLFLYTFDERGIRFLQRDARALTNQVTELRELIQDFESDDYLESAQSLHRQLIEPFVDSIRQRRLTIIPSAALHYLPFPALHDGEHFLVEDHELRILPSLGLLQVMPDTRYKGRGTLILGNPKRHNPSLDLPASETEARAIAAQSRNSKLLLRNQASDVAFRSQAPGYALIHVAGHGEFLPASPLESRLLLAPTSQSSGDISVNDLYGMRLSARLVVLSACETALNEVAPGDDLIGLLRGLLYAGSRGVIGSLWQVEDEATASLMQRLYHHLEQRKGAEQALRLAQLETKKGYAHPYFWAAFQYTGHERSSP